MISLLLTIAIAQVLPGEEIFVAEPKKVEAPTPIQEEPSIKEQTSVLPETTTKEIRAPKKVYPKVSLGNLPNYLIGSRVTEIPNSELIQKPTSMLEILDGVRVGETVEALISHSVIAFADETAPVVAQIVTGPFRNSRFIGNSKLESNSRRIFLSFDRIVVGKQIYKIIAKGVSSKGQPGLIGKYYSREAEYFAGDFLSSFVAGYFDGLVPRKTNVYGEVEADTSVDSAVKKGLASGALSSSERFREKLKKVPEFSELKGPINIKILILDQAKRE